MDDTWGTISSIIGSGSGVISLAGVIYFFAHWRGKVDSELRDIRSILVTYPPAEMWLMAKTLYDIYVLDALRHRPDLAEHGSGYSLKEAGLCLIPDYMKPLLDHISESQLPAEDIATGYLVVKNIGLELIRRMSEENKLSIQESVAILSTYLDNHNHASPDS